MFAGPAPFCTGIEQIDQLPTVTVIAHPIDLALTFCQGVYEGRFPALYKLDKFDFDQLLKQDLPQLSNPLASQLLNLSSKDITETESKEIIDKATDIIANKMISFGLAEHIDDSLRLFEESLLIDLPSPESVVSKVGFDDITITTQQRELLEERNSIDLAIYKNLQTIFLERVEALPVPTKPDITAATDEDQLDSIDYEFDGEDYFTEDPSDTYFLGRDNTYTVNLMYELVVQDFKVRYKSSYLGILWSLIHPLAILLVYRFVFGSILGLNAQRYSTFVFTGIVAWSWFQTSLISSTNSIVGNRALVKRPGFPIGLLPIIPIISELIHFLITLPLLFGVSIFEGGTVGGYIYFLPILMLFQFLFTLSLSYWTSTLYVYFRDIKYLLTISLRLFFFLTPIIYPFEQIPEQYRFYFSLNPLSHLIESYRAVIMDGNLPNLMPLLIIGFASITLTISGYLVFKNASYFFAEEI
ncbi:MAG: ABC transporter permease [Chloroflexota bacterium]